MENCASAGPNCSNSGSKRGLGPQPGREREENAVKRTVMNGAERAALPANSTEDSPETEAKGNREQRETRPCQTKYKDAL